MGRAPKINPELRKDRGQSSSILRSPKLKLDLWEQGIYRGVAEGGVMDYG